MKNVFITGGTGKIGQMLVKSLLDAECDITLLSRTVPKDLFEEKVNVIKGDLLASESYSSSLKNIDTVLHMAGLTHTNDVSRYYDVNSNGTLHLIEACKKYGVKRFVYVSTRAIAADGGDYSSSKLLAEKHVQESGLNWVIIRPSEVYGASSKEGIDGLLKALKTLPIIPIMGNGKYRIAPVYVKDVVSFVRDILERDNLVCKIYTIAGPEVFAYVQFIDKVLKLKNLKRIKIYLPVVFCMVISKVLSWIFKDKFLAVDQIPRLLSEKSSDIYLAKQDLGFNPTRIDEIID